MIEKLKEAKKAWDIKSNYDNNAIPEVYQYNLQYREETGKYPYNSAIQAFILEKENIPEELHDYLDTEIYLSQRQISRENKENYKAKMLKDGWLELTEEAVKVGFEKRQRFILNAITNNDIFSSKVETEYKPFYSEDAGARLMKPRARTRGYYLHQFKDAFYKIK